MNETERRFAELIDDFPSVNWWLRNPDHPACKWSAKVILSDGKGFYPDFIIGVSGRRAPDGVRLAEIKDTGETGRTLTLIKSKLKRGIEHIWMSCGFHVFHVWNSHRSETELSAQVF